MVSRSTLRALEANQVSSLTFRSVSTLSMKMLMNSPILVMFFSWSTSLAMALRKSRWVFMRPVSLYPAL